MKTLQKNVSQVIEWIEDFLNENEGKEQATISLSRLKEMKDTLLLKDDISDNLGLCKEIGMNGSVEEKVGYFSWCGENGIGSECVFIGCFDAISDSKDSDERDKREHDLGLTSDFLIDVNTLKTWVESLNKIEKNYENFKGVTVLAWADFNFCLMGNVDYDDALASEEYAWVLENREDVTAFKETLLKGLDRMEKGEVGLFDA